MQGRNARFDNRMMEIKNHGVVAATLILSNDRLLYLKFLVLFCTATALLRFSGTCEFHSCQPADERGVAV